MARKHKMRLKKDGEGVIARLLINHPMETGNRRDPVTGKKIPRSFIREMECLHNGRPIMQAEWSWGMARNPYVQLRLRKAAAGDEVSFRWSDNEGGSETLNAKVG